MTIEIELVSTKKKLSKSLISQMKTASVEDLIMLEVYPDRVLGYIVEKNEKIAILQGTDDWKKLSIEFDYKASTIATTECIYRNRFIRFAGEAERDSFLKGYNLLRSLAKTHIYI